MKKVAIFDLWRKVRLFSILRFVLILVVVVVVVLNSATIIRVEGIIRDWVHTT